MDVEAEAGEVLQRPVVAAVEVVGAALAVTVGGRAGGSSAELQPAAASRAVTSRAVTGRAVTGVGTTVDPVNAVNRPLPRFRGIGWAGMCPASHA